MSDGTPGPVDLICRDFTADEPGVGFVGDITQINTWEGPLYLSTMIDLFNREVAGYSMDDNYAAGLVCVTVEMADRNGRVLPKAIFHSDRGSQYTGTDFRECLADAGMVGSMGAVGSALDCDDGGDRIRPEWKGVVDPSSGGLTLLMIDLVSMR